MRDVVLCGGKYYEVKPRKPWKILLDKDAMKKDIQKGSRNKLGFRDEDVKR